LLEALKPVILTKDFNPVEFKAWVKRFRSYYNTGKMDNLAIVDQQALWRVWVDPNLEVKISSFVDDRTPIFGPDSCIELLEQEFAESYPLATRRSDYFHGMQKKGQRFSEHAAKLLRVAQEADLAALTIDDLHCFTYISTCSDKKLRDKFLKVETPTLLEFNRIVKNYERVTNANSAMDDQEGANSQVKQVKQNKREQRTSRTSLPHEIMESRSGQSRKGKH